MSGEGYRTLLECRKRSGILRAKGFSYDQIADVLALDHDLSPLRLYRHAHGRTAADVVTAYNHRDPAGTASLREARLYDYETWPSGGRRPPARALTILARIYQTTARNLISEKTYATYEPDDQDIIDRADHRHIDVNRHVSVPHPHARQHDRPAAGRGTGTTIGTTRLAASAPGGFDWSAQSCTDLLRTLHALEGDVKRRELLFELSLALGGAPALALVRQLNPDERDRLAHAINTPGGVDARAVATIEKLTAHCRRLDDTHGPQAVLPVVDAQRETIGRLLHRDSLMPALRDRLTRVYAELSQLAGYLHYDLMDYAGAERRLTDSLNAALELGDAPLIAYVHAWLASMANYQGRPSAALDHAYAAQGWIARTRSRLLQAMNQSVTAGAHALRGEATASMRALDQATALAAARRTDADPAYLYWLSPSMLQSKAALFHVQLKRPTQAMTAAAHTLTNLGPAFQLDRGFVLVHYASALIQAKEIPEATSRLREAAQIAHRHTSNRLVHSLGRARTRLTPWSANQHVRDLDENLQALGLRGMSA